MTTTTSPQSEEKIIKIPETITVQRFSEILQLSVSAVIMELMKNKILATINDEIDFETASIIAQDLGFTTQKDLDVTAGESVTLEKLLEICRQEKEKGLRLTPRPPIVTILGHVDHGKTTLLDYIRKASVAQSEVGGITQGISAYQTKKQGKYITFVDTPGHEAFASMRQRGVSLADIAILVVAADDGVKPQTKEVIAYLKEKKIPTIVAITKIDKPEAKTARVKQEVSEHGILLEGWGGDVMCAEVSGKSGKGVDQLLESILLLSEVEDFSADKKRDGLGIVLEGNLDAKKGPVAIVLVKTGTFRVGQDVVAGTVSGRIRRIENWKGESIPFAEPSVPATIIGLSDVPQSNTILQVIDAKKERRLRDTINFSKKKTISAQKDDSKKVVSVILKADTQGSLEAVQQILSTFTNDEVSLDYIDAGIGSITESDIRSAKAGEASIFGFSVEATPVAKRMAQADSVEIKTYRIIYELVDDIKTRMENLLEPEVIRTDLGKMGVLAIFKTTKKDMILGGKVIKGKIAKGANIEVMREDRLIGIGKLVNLQQNKVDVNEVKQNYECGVTFEGETRIVAGDILVCSFQEIRKRTLSASR
ncbi:MAG: translation initiation factor IF-2 [Candidatus Moraniibacteriota bacterium]|nr:MAG: translation initiation factor IF-2 [Candidatus Moranbacteria bacterium]